MSRSSSNNSTSKATRSKNVAANDNTTSRAKATKKAATDNLKYEIAGEFGVTLGADSTARQNGQVGGEITKRLVKMAKTNIKKN